MEIKCSSCGHKISANLYDSTSARDEIDPKTLEFTRKLKLKGCCSDCEIVTTLHLDYQTRLDPDSHFAYHGVVRDFLKAKGWQHGKSWGEIATMAYDWQERIRHNRIPIYPEFKEGQKKIKAHLRLYGNLDKYYAEL